MLTFICLQKSVLYGELQVWYCDKRRLKPEGWENDMEGAKTCQVTIAIDVRGVEGLVDHRSRGMGWVGILAIP